MEIKLQIGLFLVSFITLLVVLNSVVKNKMNIHYSMVWILWGIGMIILSLDVYKRQLVFMPNVTNTS